MIRYEAGPELDGKICENLFNWKWTIRNSHCFTDWGNHRLEPTGWSPFEPSTEIQHAWKIILFKDKWQWGLIQLGKKWSVAAQDLETGNTLGSCKYFYDTTELAICAATMEALGFIKEPKERDKEDFEL